VSIIAKTPFPITRQILVKDLGNLGLTAGDVVIVHSAMSQLGWVVGGALTVVQALMEVLTPEGTLVMPTFTSDNSDPAQWVNPPVPEEWWETIRAQTPLFDPQTSPTQFMGAVVECFRTFPDVRRTYHPMHSFAVWGKQADFVACPQKLGEALGEESPLARIYDLHGKILLLGVGHGNNTSLHLAEYRADYPKQFVVESTIMEEQGQRCWVSYDFLDLNTDDFEAVGADYEASIGYQPGKVGLAEARLLSQRRLVDFATQWFSTHRGE
jgi:aminoglycoside 3-N-acetyltransferase